MGSSLRARGWFVTLAVVVLVAEAVGLSPAAARPAVPATPPSAASLLSPPEGAVPDLAARGWQQVLNEDFNGSSVDESVWDVWDRDMFGAQTRQALSVGGGNLTMSTYTDPADGVNKTGSLSTGAIGAESPNGDGFEAAYGYFEARIKVGDKAGTTDAFWLMTDNGNNSMPFGDVAADGPELDVMEHGNGPNSNGDANSDGVCDWNTQAASLGVPCNELLTDAGHWDGFEEDHKLVHNGFVKNPTATPLQNNFHTYSLLWTPAEYRIYVDGIETARSTVGMSYIPEHILLTTFAGPDPTYGPLGNAANDHMVVDYVRVWQRPVSDVPDQATAANTPIAVPFLVQDYAYSSPAKPDPGTVTVTASSSDTTVVPPSGLAVAGDGIADPDGPGGPFEATDGSFQNGDFGAGTGWSLTGGASIASSKLQLTTAGGSATQAITNLRSNTTYVVGASYDLALEYTDANGNGRVDPGESFTDVNDKKARVDWGIRDVDSSLAGNQQVKTPYERDGAGEQARPSWWVREAWPEEVVKFTTGPTTTSVTLFVENTAYAGTANDSAVSFDSIVVRPQIPANRVVTIRPADGKVGQSTITLTAKNAAGTTIGSDSFVVTVGAGSIADGTFEAGPKTTPWTLLAGAQLPVADPYAPDRQLLLAQASADTVTQTVTNLTPSTRYRLDVTGRVSQSGGALTLAVQSFGGTNLSTTLTSTTQDTESIEFVTGASNTSASIVLLDWNVGDGTSTVEQVNVAKCNSVSSCAPPLATDVGSTAPPVVSTSPRSTVSGLPIAIPVRLPSGATLTGVTSTNEVLVPNPNVTVETSATDALRKVITASPLPDRTGLTKLRVAYTGAAGSPVDIPLTVSDAGVVQPGFEKGGEGWVLSGSASITTSGPRSGASALQINNSGSAVQKVAGLPHGTDLEIGAWVDGTVTVTLATVPPGGSGDRPQPLGTANWSGSGWTEGKTAFQTLLMTDSSVEDWRSVEVTITDTNPGDGVPVKVDDLSIVHRPAIRRIRDLSLHAQQTVADWNTHRPVTYGRVAANALWDPTAFSFTSTDIAGFGTGVVPAANLSPLHLFESGWPFHTMLEARAGTKTGRSLITVKLTDPATGNFTTRAYNVTVNAGNNFNNGDFERSRLGAPNTQWGAYFSPSADIVRKQGYQYLGQDNPGWAFVGPRDDNKVLRFSAGVAGVSELITGLTPSTDYVFRFRAKGNGATVNVKAFWNAITAPTMLDGSGNPASVAIAPPDTSNVWRDYSVAFRTNASGDGSTSVALFIGHTGPAFVPPAVYRPCAYFHSGEACFDDVGLFKASDVP